MAFARSSLARVLLLAAGWPAYASRHHRVCAGRKIRSFSQGAKQVLLQMNVERALAVYAIRNGKLMNTGTRISLATGPVSIRSMPR